MKRFIHHFCVMMLLSTSIVVHGMLLDSDIDPVLLEQKLAIDEAAFLKERKKSVSSVASELIDFNYNQEDLKQIINDYAKKLNLNILYPETETITAKVTFDAGRKITVTEGWNFVKMILEQAGYSLILRLPGVYTIIQNTKSYVEPLPLYIGVDFNQLPDSMERVRYVYYFSNITVAKQKTELQKIITAHMLSDKPEDKNAVHFEDGANAIILTTRADMIKAVMQLLVVLDEGGFQQTVEILKLDHALAADVVELFGKMIGNDPAKKGAGFVSTSAVPRARYFSEMIKVLNLDPDNIRHLNSIVIIGKPSDIDEVKKFIAKYLDIPQETGKSFFHVIELQWLQAADFVTVLQNLTQPGSGGSGQSTGSISSDIGFDPYIKIVAEAVRQGSNVGTSTAQGQTTGNAASGAISGIQNTVQRGANKLIVACSSRDWERIESLIRQVDVPQKQVILEALVMDLDASFARNLGAQMRTQGITTSIFPKYMQAQAGLIVNSVIGNIPASGGSAATQDYYTLTGDLSDILNPDGLASANGSLIAPNVSTDIPPPTSPTQTSSGPGPTSFTGSILGLISGGKARTGGAWAFFQLLSQHSSSKVFTRPVLMALNNQQVGVTNTLTKNLVANVTTGTNPTINYVQDQASVTMQFTPLISNNNTVNMQINLDLITYINPNDASGGTKAIRNITTNVYMKSGDVLVLGGVMQETVSLGKNSVPFFERIPIIGNFFSARNKTSDKKQLFVVIRATATKPRLQGGMGSITKSAAEFMKDQLTDTEETFANLKDPITRWFFNTGTGDEGEPSEYFDNMVNNLAKFDYGVKDLEEEKNHPMPWNEKIEQQGGNIRIGWLSDTPADNPFASPPAKSSDMDKLSMLLKDMENPYQKRLNV